MRTRRAAAHWPASGADETAPGRSCSAGVLCPPTPDNSCDEDVVCGSDHLVAIAVFA